MYPLRNKRYAESILVVNDIPGAGRVAGSINLPVVAAAQLEAAILPTLILSSHAGEQGNMVRYSMKEAYQQMLSHWEEVGYHFDAILTGYFADVQQIDNLSSYYLREKVHNPSIKLIMDPIMGDHGKFYKGFDKEVALHLRELIQHADIVMPNLTEACLILNQEYKENFKMEEIAEIAQNILSLGAETVIITGARDHNGLEENRIGFYYACQNGEKGTILHRHFDGYVFGTGDTVISLVAGNFLAGESIKQSVEYTSQIVEELIPYSIKKNNYQVGPIHFEPFLAIMAEYFINLRQSNCDG